MDYKYCDVVCSNCARQYGKCATCGTDILYEYSYYCNTVNHMCEDCKEGSS
jgi:hypothetical protein